MAVAAGQLNAVTLKGQTEQNKANDESMDFCLFDSIICTDFQLIRFLSCGHTSE